MQDRFTAKLPTSNISFSGRSREALALGTAALFGDQSFRPVVDAERVDVLREIGSGNLTVSRGRDQLRNSAAKIRIRLTAKAEVHKSVPGVVRRNIDVAERARLSTEKAVSASDRLQATVDALLLESRAVAFGPIGQARLDAMASRRGIGMTGASTAGLVDALDLLSELKTECDDAGILWTKRKVREFAAAPSMDEGPGRRVAEALHELPTCDPEFVRTLVEGLSKVDPQTLATQAEIAISSGDATACAGLAVIAWKTTEALPADGKPLPWTTTFWAALADGQAPAECVRFLARLVAETDDQDRKQAMTHVTHACMLIDQDAELERVENPSQASLDKARMQREQFRATGFGRHINPN